MDRLPPFISKFQTQVVSLAQNTRAYFEPSFNRIHIPKNALIRNYLTLAATVGLISGIALAIGRTFQYNLDKTGRKEYSFTAALKDLAGCTVFPGAGFVWRKMFGISKAVSFSALEQAAITAQTSKTLANWTITGHSFATATPEDIAKTRILLKGHHTNLDHLPVDMLALFFPQALSEWVSRSESAEPIEWANLGSFNLKLHRDDVIRGFDFRAAADAAILADDSLNEADPKKAQAKDRLDDLALELEVLLGELPRSNAGKELSNLNAALKIVEERRHADNIDVNNRVERVYKEWSLFTANQLENLSKMHLEQTDPAGETVLRLIAAKYLDVLPEYFKYGKVDHTLHNPMGKPTLLAIVLANADLSKDQRGLIDTILEGVPGEEDNKVSLYIDLSLPDILTNLQNRIIAAGRKDLSTEPTNDQLELAGKADDLLDVLHRMKKVGRIEAPAIDLANFSHLNVAILEQKFAQSQKPALLEQCRALPNAPWLASEAERISTSDPAYVFHVLENRYQAFLESSDPEGLSDDDLQAYRAKEERRFARQAEQKLNELGKNAVDLNDYSNLQTAVGSLHNHCENLNGQLQAFLRTDSPADLPALESISDLSEDFINGLSRLLEKEAWQQNKDVKSAFVKAFATATKWNRSIEENVQLVRTKFAECRTELKLLDSNPHRSAYLLKTKYQAAINVADEADPKQTWQELVNFIKASPAEVCKDLPDECITEMPVDQVASLFASGKHADAILTYKKEAIVMASALKEQLSAYDQDQQRVISSALDFMLPKAKGKLSPDQANEIFTNVVNNTPTERSVLTTRIQQTLEGLGTKGSPEVRTFVLNNYLGMLQYWEGKYTNSKDTVQKNAIAGTVADILNLLRDYSELDLRKAEGACPELAKVWLNWTRTPQELINERNWNQLYPVIMKIKDKKERDAAIRAIELPKRFDEANMSPEAFLQLFNMGVFKGKTRDNCRHNITNTIANSGHLLASDAVIAALTAPANQPLWVQGTSAIEQLAASNEWKRLSLILGRLDKKTLTTAAASIPLPEKLENITAEVLAALLSHDVFKGKTTSDDRNIVSLIIEELHQKRLEWTNEIWKYLLDGAQIPLYLKPGGAQDSRSSPIQVLFLHEFWKKFLPQVLLKMSVEQLKIAAEAIDDIMVSMDPATAQNHINSLFKQYQSDLDASRDLENKVKEVLNTLDIIHTDIDADAYPLVYKLLAPPASE